MTEERPLETEDSDSDDSTILIGECQRILRSVTLEQCLRSQIRKVIHNLLYLIDDLSKKDVNHRGTRELFNMAVEMGEDELFLHRWQSQLGSIFDIRDENGQGPLHRVCKNAYPNTDSWKSVAYYLSQGVDPNIRDNKKYATPLHYIAGSRVGEDAVQEFRSKIPLLVRAGADVNARDSSDRTPLHYCSLENGESCIFDLLRFGADIYAQYDGNQNILDYARSNLEQNGYPIEYDGTRDMMEGELDIYESVRMIIQHYTYLRCLGFPGNDAFHNSYLRIAGWFDMAEERDDYDDIFSEKYKSDRLSTDNFYKLTNDCKEEREKLRNTKLIDSISLYDVIHASTHQISRWANRKVFKTYFEEHNYQEDFPKMWYFLEIQYNAGVVRNTILPSARDSIRSLRLPLPDLCLELILEHFSNQELKDFVRMVPEVMEEKPPTCQEKSEALENAIPSRSDKNQYKCRN